MTNHPIVSREEWIAARVKLLAEEKEFTRRRDALSRHRRNLPWVKIDDYVFDGPAGKVRLSDLFRGKLLVLGRQFRAGGDPSARPRRQPRGRLTRVGRYDCQVQEPDGLDFRVGFLRHRRRVQSRFRRLSDEGGSRQGRQ